MTLSSPRGIRIAEPTAAAAVSRARKQFNNLMKKLEAERLRLAAWDTCLPQLRTLFTQELAPLVRAFDAHRKQLVILFDQAYTRKGIGKREREKLEDLISSIALELFEAGPDEELERIYDKYNENPFADDPAAEEQAIRRAMGDAFGVELGEEVDTSSPEAMFAALSEQLAERARQAEAEQQRRIGRAKPRRQSARELREQAEAQKVQQSLREIYRKLASDLHPDREPDEAERTRKTALMQRVNVAYEKKDLLALLELQVEVAHIDQGGLDRLSDERIKQYNKVLTDQLRELECETADLEERLMFELGLRDYAYRRMTPEQTLRALRQNIAQMKVQVDAVASEQRELQDAGRLKAWLKQYQIPAPDPYGDYWE